MPPPLLWVLATVALALWVNLRSPSFLTCFPPAPDHGAPPTFFPKTSSNRILRSSPILPSGKTCTDPSTDGALLRSHSEPESSFWFASSTAVEGRESAPFQFWHLIAGGPGQDVACDSALDLMIFYIKPAIIKTHLQQTPATPAPGPASRLEAPIVFVLLESVSEQWISVWQKSLCGGGRKRVYLHLGVSVYCLLAK